jgi:prevent-host-death family protein
MAVSRLVIPGKVATTGCTQVGEFCKYSGSIFQRLTSLGHFAIINVTTLVVTKDNYMEKVGIRELRDHASEILRRVREEKAQYVVTYQGHLTALLVPLDQESLVQYLNEQAIETINDRSLTDQVYGLVKRVLSDEELENLYQDQ